MLSTLELFPSSQTDHSFPSDPFMMLGSEKTRKTAPSRASSDLQRQSAADLFFQRSNDSSINTNNDSFGFTDDMSWAMEVQSSGKSAGADNTNGFHDSFVSPTKSKVSDNDIDWFSEIESDREEKKKPAGEKKKKKKVSEAGSLEKKEKKDRTETGSADKKDKKDKKKEKKDKKKKSSSKSRSDVDSIDGEERPEKKKKKKKKREQNVSDEDEEKSVLKNILDGGHITSDESEADEASVSRSNRGKKVFGDFSKDEFDFNAFGDNGVTETSKPDNASRRSVRRAPNRTASRDSSVDGEGSRRGSRQIMVPSTPTKSPDDRSRRSRRTVGSDDTGIDSLVSQVGSFQLDKKQSSRSMSLRGVRSTDVDLKSTGSVRGSRKSALAPPPRENGLPLTRSEEESIEQMSNSLRGDAGLMRMGDDDFDSMVKRANPELRQMMLDKSRKGPIRVSVKSNGGAPSTNSSSRRSSRSSLDVLLTAKPTGGSGRMSSSQSLSGDRKFNPHNADRYFSSAASLPGDIIPDEAPSTRPLRRESSRREKAAFTGSVDDILRHRRQMRQQQDTSTSRPPKPSAVPASRGLPRRKSRTGSLYSNLEMEEDEKKKSSLKKGKSRRMNAV